MYTSNSRLDVSPISSRRNLTNPLSKLDKEKERSRKPKRKHGNRNKCILHTTLRQPRRNPVIKSERHDIPNENHGNKTLATEIFVRIDNVVDGDSAAGRQTESDHPKANDETTPGDTVGGANTPEDETCGHDEEVHHEEPETLFGFADTAVSSGEFEAEDITGFTSPDTTVSQVSTCFDIEMGGGKGTRGRRQ